MNLINRIICSIIMLLFLIFPYAGHTQLPDPPYEKWKEWVGDTINVAYDCCGYDTCTVIKGATLIEVTDKIVTIASGGKQLLIPNYVITNLEHVK